MKPITREIIDRRQPLLRWSAVFAGATIAVALWVLFQMIGMGGGLAAIDLDDAGSLRSVGIGTSIWTLLSPIAALFAGGYVAGKLASTWDERAGMVHAFIAWAIASLAGVLAIVSLVGMLAHNTHIATHDMLANDIRVAPGLHHMELQRAAQDAGRMLLGGGISLLLGLAAAVAGGALSTRKPGVARRRVRHDTQEVPVVPPPPEPPANAPHVTGY